VSWVNFSRSGFNKHVYDEIVLAVECRIYSVIFFIQLLSCLNYEVVINVLFFCLFQIVPVDTEDDEVRFVLLLHFLFNNIA